MRPPQSLLRLCLKYDDLTVNLITVESNLHVEPCFICNAFLGIRERFERNYFTARAVVLN